MKSQFWRGMFGALAGVAAASTFTPARPPAIPLAVKSPYMNTWLEVGSDGGSGGILPGYWPRFWAGPQVPPDQPVDGPNGAVTGWAGLIKVDGTTYTWMGAPEINGIFPASVTQESFEYTSTRSTFIMNVDGKVSMNVTFVSPITPTDLQRQSIIGSYLFVNVASIDGSSHSVQLYADTSAEWVNPTHNTQPVQWSYITQNGIASHQSFQQVQSEFNADYPDDAAHWGSWYWSTASATGMTYQSGSDASVRGNFLSNGSLPNTQDSDYRAINDNHPVFGFANDVGNVGSSSVAIVYTIVLAQENAIYFNGAQGNVSVPSIWTSYFSADLDMVEYFYNDWKTQNGALDNQYAVDSLAAGGQDLLTITSLSVRQTWGGVQLCGTADKPYLFLKEISSDGNIQTVDVIFPAMPMFLYSNPVMVKYMLDPLFENQESGRFPQKYSIHDLGANYPRAIGHEDGGGEMMPVEECGNMLVMTLAYAQRANDVSYLSQHYNILKQWTGYLVNDTLTPDNQLSTDDFQGQLANQTNLALKGIIGIAAMSAISQLTGNSDDATNFHNIATSYISQWQSFAVVANATPPHTNLDYQDDSSHGLLYNLYADKLLSTNLVPQSIYDMQSTFYPTVAEEYGVPLDSRDLFTKSDWEMWTASIASESTKSMFLSKLANWINVTSVNRAFPDLYDTTTGNFAMGGPAPSNPFIARPVVGGHFAALALASAPSSATKFGKRTEGFSAKKFKA